MNDNYALTDEGKKRLTEYICECWHENISNIYHPYLCSCGHEYNIIEDLNFHIMQNNRTFTDWPDLGRVKEKLVEKGDFREAESYWADKYWASDSYPKYNFVDWLLNPARFCWLVNEFLKGKEE